MRRGIRRESEAEIKWREREIKGKEKIWGGGKEKANIQDAVTVRGRCVRPRYNGHGAQELATRDPSCARWIIHDTETQSPFLSTFLTRPKTAPQPRTEASARMPISRPSSPSQPPTQLLQLLFWEYPLPSPVRFSLPGNGNWRTVSDNRGYANSKERYAGGSLLHTKIYRDKPDSKWGSV